MGGHALERAVVLPAISKWERERGVSTNAPWFEKGVPPCQHVSLLDLIFSADMSVV